MLDIGSKMDSKYYPSYHMMFTFQTKGYDISVIDKNDNLPQKGIYKCDIEHESLPFKDNTFDIVLMLEVMEHLGSDQISPLQEIKRVAKPDATIIISSPNFFAFNNIFSLIFEREQKDFKSLISQHKIDRNYTAHIRVYTKTELTQLIEFAGLTVKKVMFLHNRDNMMFICGAGK